MASGIGRFFKAIWYTLSGRAHELSDRMMENPEAVRGAYEDIIADKKANVQRYKAAIGQLLALVKQKEGTVQNLTDDVDRLEQLKAGALAKAKRVADNLQKQEQAQEAIKQNPEYTRCVAAYNDFSSTLEEKNARIQELESDIENAQGDINNHMIQISALHRDLDKIKQEQAEAVADLITAREQEQIADMLSGISTDGTSAELARMRDVRQKAKGRAQVAQELAGTDSRAEEEKFLAAARESSATDEFDELIFGAQQTDRGESQEPPADSESKLPV
jgi:phage shock protein A